MTWIFVPGPGKAGLGTLVSNKDQSLKKVALFSCYIEEYVVFVSFSGALGEIRLASFDAPLKVMAPQSPPPVNMYICIPTKFKDDICRDYFP